MTMMFEVQDLAVASPATVSRCGMVYLEPSILGLKPYVNCYLKTLPDAIFDHKDKLQSLFERFLEVITTDNSSTNNKLSAPLRWPLIRLSRCLSQTTLRTSERITKWRKSDRLVRQTNECYWLLNNHRFTNIQSFVNLVNPFVNCTFVSL